MESGTWIRAAEDMLDLSLLTRRALIVSILLEVLLSIALVMDMSQVVQLQRYDESSQYVIHGAAPLKYIELDDLSHSFGSSVYDA